MKKDEMWTAWTGPSRSPPSTLPMNESPTGTKTRTLPSRTLRYSPGVSPKARPPGNGNGARAQLPHRLDAPGADLRHELGRRLGGEERLAGQALVEDHRERVDVGRRPGVARARDLLRRHVAERPAELAGLRERDALARARR